MVTKLLRSPISWCTLVTIGIKLVVFIHADRYQCTGATITFEIVLSVANSILQRTQDMNKLISHFPH